MNERRLARAAAILVAGLCAAACAKQPRVEPVSQSRSLSVTAADRDCMSRAMYFESHRSADEGMLAVGTVVANRVESGRYGATVCEVVSQKGQFASGVMTRTMEGEAAERARRAADAVLGGERHPGVRKAMFFHTAGLRFRYPNMHYVLVAGGNAFYEKRDAATRTAQAENARSRALALAYARVDPTGAAKLIVVASLEAQGQAAAAEPPAAPSLAASPAAPALRAEPVAYAAAERPAAVIPAPRPRPASAGEQAPAPRVLSPASLAPVLASSTPATAPAADGAPAEPARNPVAAAFSAFEAR